MILLYKFIRGDIKGSCNQLLGLQLSNLFQNSGDCGVGWGGVGWARYYLKKPLTAVWMERDFFSNIRKTRGLKTLMYRKAHPRNGQFYNTQKKLFGGIWPLFPCRSIRKQSAMDNLNQGGRLKSDPLNMCGKQNMQVMSYFFYRVKQ